jgi:hypothetical protein
MEFYLQVCFHAGRTQPSFSESFLHVTVRGPELYVRFGQERL